jgi:muramoyltetrapeptide carboxypeptidase
VVNKKWEALKEGDLIDVIAPASAFSYPDLKEDLTSFINNLGFQARVPKNILVKGADAFSANTDKYRFEQLRDALYAEDSKAIWCLRGGYGSAKLTPNLTSLKPPAKAKAFIGFSDITALHIFLQQNWGWCTIHGKVLSQFLGPDKEVGDALDIKDLLLNKNPNIIYKDLVPLNVFAEQEHVIESSIIGGNLTIIQTSIGTNWQLNAHNKIILFEDVDERGYKIDRAFEQFIQSGILGGAKAILFGDFTGGLEKDGYSLCSLALNQAAKKMNIPVLSCPGIGHSMVNKPIPLGTKVTLKLGNNPHLICESGAK